MNTGEPRTSLEKKEEINPLSEELLNINLSKFDEDNKEEQLEIWETLEKISNNPQVLQDKEIEIILQHFLPEIEKTEKNKFFITNSILNYLSEFKIKDKKTDENTLDRSHRILFDLAEKFPQGVSDFMGATHHMFEFVKPDVFFDSYLKIRTSENLKQYKNYILGQMFSQLEYNMSYMGIEKYIEALIKKIDFRNAKSCFESSQFMNIAASLADYANSGSYSGNYNVGEKITETLKSSSLDPKAIYLLGAKAKYISDRIEKDWPPFNHQREIFELAPGILATSKNDKIYITKSKDKEISDKFNKYKELSENLEKPPQELIDQAHKNGQDTVSWTQDRNLIILVQSIVKKISDDMIEINKKDILVTNNISISNEQLIEYQHLMATDFRDFLEEEFNVKFKKLTIPEQFFFLEYIQTQTQEMAEKTKIFSSKYKENGLKTFLSIEQGGKEMGDKILTLGEKLPENVAEEVFKKYGEVIDSVNKITEFARSNFTKEIETTPLLVKKIEETLYIKGKQLLLNVYDDIKESKEINYEEIIKQLDRINADTITTFAIFKQAVRNGENLPIESIEGAVFSKKGANEISNEQKTEMDELYDRNYINHPDREFIAKVKEYFNTAFIPEENKNKNFFYTFEKDGKTRAFVRFEENKDLSLYASALNVDEASKNFGLGEAMMDEALLREAKEHILRATCLTANPSNMRYFEKGFIAQKFKLVDQTNQFDLVWDENQNKNIIAKQLSTEALSNEYTEKKNNNLLIKKSKKLNELHTEIPEGFSLVRCFIKNDEWYAVYEVVSPLYGRVVE